MPTDCEREGVRSPARSPPAARKEHPRRSATKEVRPFPADRTSVAQDGDIHLAGDYARADLARKVEAYRLSLAHRTEGDLGALLTLPDELKRYSGGKRLP